MGTTTSENENNGMSRRALLAQTGRAAAVAGVMSVVGASAGAASAQQGTVQPSQPQSGNAPDREQPPLPPAQRVGIAVAGIGEFASQQVIPSFGETRMCRLAGFVTGDKAKGRAFAERFGVDPNSVYGYDEMARMKDNKGIDAVYVITPNALHKPNVLAAAAAGKHVLCQKPMATNSKDCQDMIEACRKAGRKLMIAYRAHYEPYNFAAIEICRSGKLGRIVSITADHGRNVKPEEKADSWRVQKALSGGGSLVDIGIYSLNATRYLTGEEPTEVYATIYSPPNDPRFKEVEANVHFVLRFPSGVIANCTSSYEYHDVKRYQVFGSKATLTLDPATDYYQHTLLLDHSAPDGQTLIREDHKIEEKNQFAREMDHFADCVLNNREPKTPGEEGLRDLRYIEAIYESARTGKPVKLHA